MRSFEDIMIDLAIAGEKLNRGLALGDEIAKQNKPENWDQHQARIMLTKGRKQWL